MSYIDEQVAMLQTVIQNIKQLVLHDIGTGAAFPPAMLRDSILGRLQLVAADMITLQREMQNMDISMRWKRLNDTISDEEVDLVLEWRKAHDKR